MKTKQQKIILQLQLKFWTVPSICLYYASNQSIVNCISPKVYDMNSSNIYKHIWITLISSESLNFFFKKKSKI